MEKINNKGFTLIELLATIVVLAIVSAVTIVSVTGSFQKSKEKAEEAFRKQLEDYVYDYIAMYGSKLNFDDGVSYKKCYLDDSDCKSITLKGTLETNANMNIKFVSDTFANQDIVNPNTKNTCVTDNDKLTIYRDDDFVYCFTIKPINNNSCLYNSNSGVYNSYDKATVSTCENMYKPISGSSCPIGSKYDNGTGYCTFKLNGE